MPHSELNKRQWRTSLERALPARFLAQRDALGRRLGLFRKQWLHDLFQLPGM